MKELLRLPAGELGEAIARLLASLDGELDENAQGEWEDEIKRRIEDLSSGRVQPVPLAEARRRIFVED